MFIIKEMEGEICVDRITTEIKILVNGNPSLREKKMLKRKIAILKVSCENCIKILESQTGKHKSEEHEKHEETESMVKRGKSIKQQKEDRISFYFISFRRT